MSSPWRFAGAAGFLISTLLLVPGTAMASPALDATEGQIHFGLPGSLAARVVLPGDWVADWGMGLREENAPIQGFQFEAENVRLTYVLRTTVLDVAGQPHVNEWNVEETDLSAVGLEIRPRDVERRELIVKGHGAEVWSAGPLNLSTTDPAVPPPTAIDAGAMASASRLILLEGRGIEIRSENAKGASFYGYEVTVRSPDRAEKTYRTGEESSAVAINSRQVRTEHILHFDSDRGRAAALGGEPAARVQAPRASMEGVFQVASPAGHLRQGAQDRELDGQPLRLEGAMLFTPAETQPDQVPYAVHVQGLAVGEPVVVPAAPGRSAPWVVGVAVVAGVGLLVLLLVFVAPLFSRVAPDQALVHETRQRLYQALEQHPGISIAELAAVTDLAIPNARYHLGVLERSAKIRSFRVQGEWRYVRREEDAKRLQRRIALESDPQLQFLVELLSGETPVPATRVVHALITQRGLSRSGGWRVVKRALQAEIVSQARAGSRMVLTLADKTIKADVPPGPSLVATESASAAALTEASVSPALPATPRSALARAAGAP